jgi:hypothetical protein
MSRDKAVEALESLEPVRERIEQWRRRGRQGRAMPPELWRAAAQLAAEHGVYVVSRQLKVGFAKLRTLAQQYRAAPERSAAETASFVELHGAELFGAPGAAVASSLVVELLEADGARLRLSVSGPAALQPAAIVSAFRRGGCQRCCS